MAVTKHVMHYVIWIACAKGMIWRIYYISEQYLTYGASTHIIIDQMKQVTVPTLYISVNATQILSTNHSIHCLQSHSNNLTNIDYYNFHCTPKSREIVLAYLCKLRSSKTVAKEPCGRNDSGKSMLASKILYSVQYAANTTTFPAEIFLSDIVLFEAGLDLRNYSNITHVDINLHTRKVDRNGFDSKTDFRVDIDKTKAFPYPVFSY